MFLDFDTFYSENFCIKSIYTLTLPTNNNLYEESDSDSIVSLDYSAKEENCYYNPYITISHYDNFAALNLFKSLSLTLITTCVDIVVYDNPRYRNRFSIVYVLLSSKYNYRICVNMQFSELQPIISISSLFTSVNWSERECWDLFGIFFIFNTDLRRILTDYGFKGNPLKKDFPLTGFYEVHYNDAIQHISQIRIELTQEFRIFTFNSRPVFV